jgi:hypothetical protein
MKWFTGWLRVLVAGAGQCSRCGGWFPDWDGGVCDACRSAGRE